MPKATVWNSVSLPVELDAWLREYKKRTGISMRQTFIAALLKYRAACESHREPVGVDADPQDRE